MTEVTVAGSIAFAIYAGVLTFFSPCAYPLLPGYVGFYVSQVDGRSSLGGALARGLIAGVGVLFTLGAFIGVTFVVGASAVERLTLIEPAVGVVLIAFGLLVLLGRAPSLTISLPKRRSSVLGFAVFGSGYAIAAAGCVAPLFLSVIGLSLTLETVDAALVVGSYVGSVVVLMISLTIATGMGLIAGGGWLTTNRDKLERFAGFVLIVAGFGQLYVAFYLSAPV